MTKTHTSYKREIIPEHNVEGDTKRCEICSGNGCSACGGTGRVNRNIVFTLMSTPRLTLEETKAKLFEDPDLKEQYDSMMKNRPLDHNGWQDLEDPKPRTHTSYTGPTGMQPEGGLMEILNAYSSGKPEQHHAGHHNAIYAYNQIIQWVSEQVIGEDVPAVSRHYVGVNEAKAQMRARLHSTNQEQQ